MAVVSTRVFEVEILVEETAGLVDGGPFEMPAVILAGIEVGNPGGVFTTNIEIPAVVAGLVDAMNPTGVYAAAVEVPAVVAGELEAIN